MSDDIWVRNDPQAGPHQNPEAGQVNYVHVLVRNRSNVRAYDTPVKVYFANASTGLSWPIHWTQIGNPQIIPTLDPNQTAEIVVQWTPTQTGHFCLLSRLDTPQDPMTFTETIDIEYNVRYNNNIVWKNVNVVDLVLNPIVPVSFIFRAVRRAPLPDAGAAGFAGFAGFAAMTGDTQPDLTRLTFREPRQQAATNPFLKRGRVRVVFPDKLRELMKEQGVEPRGFEQIDDKTFSVKEPTGAYIELYLSPGDEFNIDMTFEDTVAHAAEKIPVRYGFDVVQEQEKQVVGGVSYNIQALPPN